MKGGFDRTDFFRKCETSFDKRTGYDRAPEQTFDYLNTMKNGTPKEIFQKKEWAERVNHERLEKMKAEWSRDLQEQHQEQGREESQQQGNSISQVPEINQAPQRKKQQEEEIDQPRKRSRGFGMGMWFYSESMDLVLFTKNFCRSQNKFADIRKKLQEPVAQNCPGIVPL